MSFVHSLRLKEVEDKSSYPFTIPIIQNLKILKFHPLVTFFTGENGSGKSTLIEALATKLNFNPEGGSKYVRFATKHSHSSLHEHIRVHKNHIFPKNSFFLRSENFYNIATIYEQYDQQSLHEKSHGESFLHIFLHRFGKNGLYILDEPESALSPTAQMAFLSRIHELVKQNCQFIIATHSPMLISYPNSFIYECQKGELSLVKYEESELYRTTKYFLQNYEKMHKELFK